MSLHQPSGPQLPWKPEIGLVVGRAPWWTPPDTRHKPHPSFTQELRDLMTHLSFHCYAKVVERGRSWKEKTFWALFHAGALAVLIAFLWRTHAAGDDRMLSTTIFHPHYPIQKVAFPAVSICSLNRISNASAGRLAEELNAKDPLQRGFHYFYNEIEMLNYNYFMMDNDIDYERLLAFQRFLDLYDSDGPELFYNTKKRLKMLTPSCQDLLLKCYMSGREFNCADKFVESLTKKGYCCTFNHNGEYSKERPFHASFFGPAKGLVVYLNASTDDYFLRARTVNTFLLLIYAAGNFPDIFSGAVGERPVQTGIDSSKILSAKIVETVSQARHLTPKSRKCLFHDEMPRVFGKKYTFNKCITRCRMRSVAVLCKCLPFYAAEEFQDVAEGIVYCTLQHRSCMNRYKFKWLNVITERQNAIHGLERETEEALYCPQCLPSCSETQYQMTEMDLPLNQYSTDVVGNNSRDLALVRVFFGKPHAQYLRQIVNNDWFDVFSTIGGICSIIAGFSLIGCCEIVFFLGRQLIRAYKDEVEKDRSVDNCQSMPELLIVP